MPRFSNCCPHFYKFCTPFVSAFSFERLTFKLVRCILPRIDESHPDRPSRKSVRYIVRKYRSWGYDNHNSIKIQMVSRIVTVCDIQIIGRLIEKEDVCPCIQHSAWNQSLPSLHDLDTGSMHLRWKRKRSNIAEALSFPSSVCTYSPKSRM